MNTKMFMPILVTNFQTYELPVTIKPFQTTHQQDTYKQFCSPHTNVQLIQYL
jgi:hypothetical protein